MAITTGQDILAADVLKIILPAEININTSFPALSGLQAAGYSVIESSGAGTIKPIIPILSFDDTTDEGRIWIFRMPLITSGSLYLYHAGYMAGANTTKTVKIAAQLAAIGSGDASVAAKVFAAVNSQSKAVPDAAGTYFQDSFVLTNADSITVGDWACLAVFRDVSEDDAVGDYNMTAINLMMQA